MDYKLGPNFIYRITIDLVKSQFSPKAINTLVLLIFLLIFSNLNSQQMKLEYHVKFSTNEIKEFCNGFEVLIYNTSITLDNIKYNYTFIYPEYELINESITFKSKNSRINLFIPVAFQNQGVCPGLKRGGVLTVVRQDVELVVNATDIPSELIVDLSEFELGDTITISDIKLPEGAKPTIMGRDFVIANIQAPSGLRSTDNESEGDDTEESEEETATQE